MAERAEETQATRDESWAQPMRGVTLRAALVGLALIPPNAYWLAVIELIRNTGTPTSVSLFYNAVFTLLALVLLNAAVGRVLPRLALTSAELAFAYVLITLGSAMAGIDMFCCLPPMMAYPARYATPENGWQGLFLGLLPQDLIVTDTEALRGFWEGGGTLYGRVALSAWTAPVLRWMAFTAGLVALWSAMTAIFSPRWIASERLTYPIGQLPAELCFAPRRLTLERVFEIGFGAAAGIALLNGLHGLSPSWPAIPVKPTANPAFHINAQIVDPPWNAMGAFMLSFYPFAIGLGLLLPTRLSMSCWVFYLVRKAQHILANQAGSWTTEGIPYTREQSVGAFLGLLAFSLYMSRGYLAGFAREALAGRRAEGRPLAPRTALVLLAASFGFLVWFSVGAGMTPAFAVGFLGLYAALCLSFTRIRAEMGVPAHELHMVGPGQTIFRWLGSRVIGPQNLATSALFFWFNRAYRSHPMPHLAEGLKLCERGHMPQRRMLGWAAAAMMVGALSSVWAILHIYYRDGAAAKWGPWYHSEWIPVVPYGELATVLKDPTDASPGMVVASLVGVVATFGLMAAHTFVPWWPLHPVGYAVSNAWAFDHMWFSILIAWCVKSLVTRYGGAQAIRRLSSLAFGLILGDFTMGSLWSLYGMWKGVATYTVWV